ncbi:MAG: tetratricopeptide repeat protein [Euryarchaeota archaeon]|nr:tetratricopeptide repeat protein [Euryarchaeota archaeon]
MDETEAHKAFNRGSQLYNEDRLEEAIEYYKRALKLFKKFENTAGEADTLLEMGNTYGVLKDLDKASEYFRRALVLYGKNKDIVGEGYAFTGLGSIFEKYERYEESREYYLKAFKKFQKAKDYVRQGVVSNLIANSYETQGAFDDAIMDNENALELFQKAGDHKRESEINKVIERIKAKQSKFKPSRKDTVIFIFYLIALVGAEFLTTYYSMKIGLLIHSILLFTLLIHSSLHGSYSYSNLLRSMMVLPMIRIIGLSIPIMQVKPLYWFPIISIPLFAASFVIMKTQRINRERVGLILGNIKVQLAIASTGIILGVIEYFILKPKPLIPIFNLQWLLLGTAIIIISTGLAEELLFRGLIQKNAENVLGRMFGLLYVSLLFTSLHVGWESFIDLIFVFSVSMFYGYAFQRTRSLFGITLSHGLSNTVLFLISPFFL